VEKEEELLLLIKTHAERVEALGARLRALQPYELPEMIVLAIDGGHRPYLDWLADAVR
jgi:periplasmic divalent cation tolerance protein